MSPRSATRSNQRPLDVDWYDYPQYFDLAFRDETRDESAFIAAAAEKYAAIPVRRLLEPACGSGRLVVALAAQGYDMVGFDLSRPMLDYTRRKLARRKLSAELFEADMADFQLALPVDAAFNTFNSFRHLLTEAAARRHLERMAQAVRPGGVFILGLHLFPPDVEDTCIERWTARHGTTSLTATLRVLSTDRKRRLEQIRMSLRVRTPNSDLRLRSEFQLRTYTHRQFLRLLASVPQWELLDVFDFWYDLAEPLELNDDMSDTVLILRRR